MIITESKIKAVHRLSNIAESMQLAVREFDSSDDLSDVLDAFPVLTKKRLAELYQDGALKNSSLTALFSETSGTSGQPLQTPRGREELRWNSINQLFAYKKLLHPAVDRVAVVHPSIMSPFVEATCMALHQLGIGYLRIFPIPEVCDYQRIYDVFQRYGITSVVTTPTLIRKILFEFSKLNNANLSDLAIENLLLTGEVIDSLEVDLLQRLFDRGIKVVPFVYGSSEIAAAMIGREDLLYEPIKEDFIFEIVKNEDSFEKKDTLEGRLLVTWLRDSIVPIIRYDTGDYVRVHMLHDDNDQLECLEILGRHSYSANDIKLIKRVEKTIEELSIKVFHYDLTRDEGAWVLSVISSMDAEKNIIKEKLEVCLGGLIININEESHPFCQFSIKPKMSRYSL